MSILPSLNSIKIGLTLVVENEPFLVSEASFMRTAQRKPVMRTKLKSLRTGKVLEITFKHGDKVEEAEVEKRKVSYLYQDERFAYFMDVENFEQYSFEIGPLREKLAFLKEGELMSLTKFEGAVVSVDLPVKVSLKVVTAAPAVRGDTAQGGVMKEATLETGKVVRVPLFIQEGDTVVVNTESGEYVERVS